jgi:hypothetical protein
MKGASWVLRRREGGWDVAKCCVDVHRSNGNEMRVCAVCVRCGNERETRSLAVKICRIV